MPSYWWQNVVKYGKGLQLLYVFVLHKEKVTILELKLSQKW